MYQLILSAVLVTFLSPFSLGATETAGDGLNDVELLRRDNSDREERGERDRSGERGDHNGSREGRADRRDGERNRDRGGWDRGDRGGRDRGGVGERPSRPPRDNDSARPRPPRDNDSARPRPPRDRDDDHVRPRPPHRPEPPRRPPPPQRDDDDDGWRRYPPYPPSHPRPLPPPPPRDGRVSSCNWNHGSIACSLLRFQYEKPHSAFSITYPGAVSSNSARYLAVESVLTGGKRGRTGTAGVSRLVVEYSNGEFHDLLPAIKSLYPNRVSSNGRVYLAYEGDEFYLPLRPHRYVMRVYITADSWIDSFTDAYLAVKLQR